MISDSNTAIHRYDNLIKLEVLMMYRTSKLLPLLIVAMAVLTAQTWNPIGPMASQFHSIEISPHDADMRVAAVNNSMFKSTDQGANWRVNWSPDSENGEYLQIRQLEFDPADPQTIYFYGKITFDSNLPENGLYKSTDGGGTFVQVLQSPISGFDIHPVTGRVMTFKDGDNGNLFVSDNGGEAWTEQTDQPNRINDLSFDAGSDDTVYATTYYGIYKSVDGGETWTVAGLDGINTLLCEAHPTESGIVYVGSPIFGDEFLYRTVDGGANWDLLDLPYNDYVVDHPQHLMFGGNPDNIFIAETNEIFVSVDSGENWSTYVFWDEAEYWSPMDIAVNVGNDTEIIVVTENASVKSLDGGLSYTRFEFASGWVDVVETVVNPDGGYHLYAGSPIGLNRYTSVEDMWYDYTTPGFIGVAVKGLATSPDMPNMVLIGEANAINNGLIYRSTNLGETESLVWDNMYYFGGIITELENDPINPGTFYATTWHDGVPAELVRSTDYGINWEVIDGEDQNHHDMTDVVVDYHNSGTLYTFGDGRVAKTTDGGETWMTMDNGIPFEGVYDGAISAFDSDILLASVDSGMYRTTDGGESWIQVNPNDCMEIEFSPYVPHLAAAITFDHDIIISYDDGETWEDANGNMPNANLTDIAFSVTGGELLVSTMGQGVYITTLSTDTLAPQNLSADVAGFNVSLSWDAVDNAHGYAVYRDGEWISSTDSQTTTFLDYYLLAGSYSYQVATIINEVEVALSTPLVVFVDDNELPAPMNLSAEIQDFVNVALNWEAPEAPVSSPWLHYDSGEHVGTYNAWIGGNYDLAIKYDPEDLTDYDGQLLSFVRFIPVNDLATYLLRIWTGADGETLAYEQALSGYTIGEWNDFELDTYHVIDASQPLYIGFNIDFFGGDVYTVDAGPSVRPGYSDLVRYGLGWDTLGNAFFMDANLNIQGLVEPVRLSEARQNLTRHLRETLNDVNVYRDGLQIASTGNGEATNYVDMDVPYDNYEYAVTAVWNAGESTISNVAGITVNNPYLPPSNLMAEQTDVHAVQLEWETPLFVGDQTSLQYDSGQVGGMFNSFSGGNFDLANRYDPEDLADHDGHDLTHISFIPVNEFGTYGLRIWTGENAETLVYEQAISSFTLGEWNDFALDTPYVIDASQPIYIGFNVEFWWNDGFTYDEGPAVRSGYSDLIGSWGTWYTLADYIFVDANVNLSATITAPAISPDITGYNVYDNGEVVTNIAGSETLDYLVNDLNYGDHLFHVTTLYEAIESTASNLVSVELLNPYLPPTNLNAEQTGVQDVLLEWEVPVFADEEAVLQYDSGNNMGVFNSWAGGNYDLAIRYDPEDLSAYTGGVLTHIRFIPVNDIGSYGLRIWTGENAENLVYQQFLSGYTLGEPNEFALDTPYVIDTSQTLYIGFNVEFFGGDGFTHDEGPAVRPGYSDLIGSWGTWYTLADFIYVDANLNLSATITVPADPPDLTGYNIYGNDEMLTYLAGAEVTSHELMDLAFGEYSFFVTAVYTESESPESDPVEVILYNPYGDVNGDFSVDISDVVLAIAFILQTETPTQDQLDAGDVNEDGWLNILDIVSIVDWILGSQRALASPVSAVDLKTESEILIIQADGDMAGIQLELNAGCKVNGTNLPEGWAQQWTDTRFVAVSLDGSGMSEIRLALNGSPSEGSVLVADWHGNGVSAEVAMPVAYALNSAYPNPFNPSTTIGYQLVKDGFVSLRVFDLTGREVSVLVDAHMQAGYHTQEWNAEGTATGLYLIMMEADGFAATQKVMYVK